MFFYGSLSPSGECLVEIPKLKEVEAKEGTLTVEAIVDSVYFKLFESPVEIKNPIEVKMVQTPKIKQTVPETHVKFEGFVKDKPNISKAVPIIVEQDEIEEEVIPEIPMALVNPYVPLDLKKIQPRDTSNVEGILRKVFRKQA